MPAKGWKSPPRPLTPQEDLVVTYRMEGDSKKKALLRAGYAESTAITNCHQIFDRPAVANELRRRQRVQIENAELTEEWVIRRLMQIAAAPELLARFKKILPDGTLDWDFTEATEEDLVAITNLTVTKMSGEDGSTITKLSIGISEPKAAMDSLLRTLGAFKDKVSVDVGISLVDRIIRGRERARIIEHDPDEAIDS